jgi:prevent-host-death family protein
MTEIGILEARASFAKVIREASEGRPVTITRRGKPVARIVPIEDGRQPEIDSAVARLREARKGVTLGGISWKELRDEGRKY